MPELCTAGLNAIEAYHSDHGPEETAYFVELAHRYGLLVTGGSDFHGETVKPGVKLGSGYQGNLRVLRCDGSLAQRRRGRSEQRPLRPRRESPKGLAMGRNRRTCCGWCWLAAEP